MDVHVFSHALRCLSLRQTDKLVVNPEAGEVRIRLANLRGNEVFGAHVAVTFMFRDIDDCGDVFYNVVDLQLTRSVRPF